MSVVGEKADLIQAGLKQPLLTQSGRTSWKARMFACRN